MIEHTLSREDLFRACAVGAKRQAECLLDGWHMSQWTKGTPPAWDRNVEGACAELAAARALGLPWSGERTLGEAGPGRRPDVGERIEVRWVSRPDGVLLVQEGRDRPDWWYVLVRGYAPTYEVVGYIKGETAFEHPEWQRTYPERTVHAVPQAALTPIYEPLQRAA